ncbi:hypothetical protein HF670_08100 [Acidithiobacillus thiooxidans]|uniref:hypothetical protein n=1 Tax=Acidithiobacillus thiooxidans TaxID=930 RepID=UPI001C07757D|nr:hypothetical protein [Acidithiobacillus thiooxidans]MBU2839524.1 hypothetical protein [Acidithiobacillus thiooxidans]
MKSSIQKVEPNEEIVQQLQFYADYCKHLLSLYPDILEFNQQNGIITTPEEEASRDEQYDKDYREYCLAKLKLNAYEQCGVLLSDKDAKKLLKKKTAKDLVRDYDKIIANFIHGDDSSKTHDKFKLQINKNKEGMKTLLTPYITQVVQPSKAQSSRAPKKPPRRAVRSSAKSGDSNSDPDPEPEPPRQLYTFKSFAQLVDCSEKTLRNKVSAGLFPQPQKTAFGPRFTQQHLDFAVTPAKPAGTRGRPRIADLVAGGVQ